MADLPFELIEDILRRLPVKTLKRFRAVAKSWHYLIDSKQFAKSHLRQSQISNSHRHLIAGGFPAHSIDLDTLDKADAITTPFNYSNVDRISSSCNGIVLVGSVPPVMWNPFTRDYKILPKLPVEPPYKTMYAVGYDSKNDDYKVACVGKFGDQAWIYGLKSNCWRRLEVFSDHRFFYVQRFGLHVNGALHVHARMRIMAINVESEEHYEVMLPPPSSCWFPDLSVFDECLCLVGFCWGASIVIWVMKEYGVVESWTRLISVSYYPPTTLVDYYVCPIVYSRERDKILLKCRDRKLFWYEKCYENKFVWYDLSHGTVENVVMDDMPYLPSAELCVETLISPNRCSPPLEAPVSASSSGSLPLISPNRPLKAPVPIGSSGSPPLISPNRCSHPLKAPVPAGSSGSLLHCIFKSFSILLFSLFVLLWLLYI